MLDTIDTIDILCYYILILLLKEMRIYLKLLPILLLAFLSVAWLPTTAKVIASLPRSEGQLAPILVEKIRAISEEVLGDELEELLAVSNVQEIIWRLQEQGAVDREIVLQALLQYQLEHSEVRNVHNLNAGLSGARLLELDNGLRAVFKTADNDKDNFNRELLLYRFDNLIGTHVVPLTTIRTLAGEQGSVQLYVENSLSAHDILVAKRRQLGLSDDEQYSHLLFRYAITPSASPAIKTLRLLSLDRDYDNHGNYLLTLRGRQIAIDGGRAFTADPAQVVANIHHLQENPEEYLLTDHIVANIEEHFVIIEEMFADHRLKQDLHDTFASYQEVVKKKSHVTGKKKKKVTQVMLEALAKEDWQVADDLFKSHKYTFYNEKSDLQKIAMRQRNWQLLGWMSRHWLSVGGEALEYALITHDYEFAARLSALGMETGVFDAMHENLQRAVAQEQNIAAHSLDWDVINWEAIDWQAVRAYADPAYHHLDSTVVDKVWEYLDTALQLGGMEAVDSMLHNYGYGRVASTDLQLALVTLLGNDAIVKDPHKAAWLMTNKVVIRALAHTGFRYDERRRVGEKVISHIMNYVSMLNPDIQEIRSREIILAYICLVYLQHQEFLTINGDDLSSLVDHGKRRRLPKEQTMQRLQRVLDIFQANGVNERDIAFFQATLDVL